MVFGLLIYTNYLYRATLTPLHVQKIDEEIERTMVLGEDLNYYVGNEMYSPCFDEHLTREAFTGLSYYGSASDLFTLFEKTDPDIIVDKIGIAPELFQRFPSIQSTYPKVRSNTYQKINN